MRRIALGYLVLCLLAWGLKTVVALPGFWGYAPINLGIGPGSQPIELVVWFDDEQHAWIYEAAQNFQAGRPSISGRPIALQLVAMDSWQMVDRVARQDWGEYPPPTVLSPASSFWIDELRIAWAGLNAGDPIARNGVTPMVLSPLVLVAWEDRARRLWPDGMQRFWWDIHAAASDPQGWAGVTRRAGFPDDAPQVAEAQAWGQLKLGLADPLESNSGSQSLVLMAYGFYERTSGLELADMRNPELRQWLDEIRQVVPPVDRSSADVMRSMVQFGPGRYDLALVYEHVAIQHLGEAQERWDGALRVYYPPKTIFSDYPYAILNAPLTGSDQRAAAERLRSFLRDRPQQQLARQRGFRPADASVPIMSEELHNPFYFYNAYGIQAQLGQQVERLSREELDALLILWANR